MAIDNFETPLYSVAEASRYLGVPDSTLRAWVGSYTSRTTGDQRIHVDPLVTTISGRPRGAATIPFVGLAEGMVLAGIRKAGVPLQRIRPAVDRLEAEFGLEHVLASKQLYTDGAEVLFDVGKNDADVKQLVVVRNGQHVFTEVVEQYLKRIDFGSDGYAKVLRLPGYQHAEVVIDPRRGFGQPTFMRGGARVEDALGLFQAGESLATVAEEYGVPESQLEDALRVASRAAA